jgi:hypothetical protein
MWISHQYRSTSKKSRATTWVLAVALLAMQVTLVAGIAVRTAPTVDEPAHLASGLYHWQTGRFDAYRVNPPLIRLWCTWPLVVCGAAPRLSPPIIEDGSRLEWQLDDLLWNSWTYHQLRHHLWIARLMLLPLVMLGGIYCWRWATIVYGAAAGWAAWMLWIASPNIMAWSATICPDVAATSLGLAASFHFRLWLRAQRKCHAALTGVFAGLAILSKSTWSVLPVLLLTLMVVQTLGRSRRFMSGRQAAGTLLVAGAVVHLGYGFVDPCRSLAAFRFHSRLLSGQTTDSTANRFAESWLGRLPIVLPSDFVLGIDRQRYEFEQRKWSYLAGQWRRGGWLYYYAACALWKTPTAISRCWFCDWSVAAESRSRTCRPRARPCVKAMPSKSCGCWYPPWLWPSSSAAKQASDTTTDMLFPACHLLTSTSARALQTPIQVAYDAGRPPRSSGASPAVWVLGR